MTSKSNIIVNRNMTDFQKGIFFKVKRPEIIIRTLQKEQMIWPIWDAWGLTICKILFRNKGMREKDITQSISCQFILVF